MKIYLESNCCTRRNYEMTKVYNYFLLNDYEVISHPKGADYIVLSTCAFKQQEEEYSLSRIRFLKQFPAKFYVFGCLPDIAPKKFSEFAGIESIAPKDLAKIDSLFPNVIVRYSEIEDMDVMANEPATSPVPTALQKFKRDFKLSGTFGMRIVRYLEKKIEFVLKPNGKISYLHICKGCLGNCSYCAIKRAIGALESRSLGTILRQFDKALGEGYTDFVILGDDVGAYGRDIDQTFPELLSHLVKERERSPKGQPGSGKNSHEIGFHIQEIHPKWLMLYKQTMLDLIASGKIKSILCPIESGNNRILDLMNRRYNADDILEFFQKARAIYPEIELSTHLIVGFPSESEEEFEETLSLTKRIHFDKVTIFPYDPREGTAASNITPQTDERIKKRRLKKAQDSLRRDKIKTFLSCPE